MNSTIVAVELDRQIPPGVVSAIGPWPTLAYVRGQYARHDGGDVAGTCGIDTPLSFALVELLPTIKHKCRCRIIRPLMEAEANVFTLVRATRRHVSDFGQYPPMPVVPADWLMVGRAQWSRSFEGTPGGTYFVHGIAGWAVIKTADHHD